MRQQDKVRLRLRDGLLERKRISVRRVRGEQIVFDKQHFIKLCCGKLARQPRDTFANDSGSQAALGFVRNLLGRRQCL